MAYVLKDLLRIRHAREEVAKNELAKAQNIYLESIKKVEKAEKDLEKYKEWRKKEEERLFEEIKNQKVRKNAIDILKMDFMKLKDGEVKKKQAVENAKKKREEAKEKMKEAKATYNHTLLKLQKLIEHKEAWMEEWRKEQEMLAEKEFEDFKPLQVNYT